MTDWQAVRSDSAVIMGLGRLRRRFTVAVGESTVSSAFSDVVVLSEQAAAQSRTGAVARTLSLWTRGSWLYRWLTTEPETEPIVINLRETRTLGPVLVVIDRLARRVQQMSRESSLVNAVGQAERVFQTAPVQILGIVAFVTVLVNTLASAALGTPTDAGLGARLVLLALATLATRIDKSWAELREGRTGRVLRAIFEPPPLPDERTEDHDESDEFDER